MNGIIIDCKTLSQRIRNEIAEEVAYLQKTYSVTPSLAVIRVGNDTASYTYVQNKKKACNLAGITSIEIHLPAHILQSYLIETIQHLNNDSMVHGILVQLPLPEHIKTDEVIETIDPKKDVDGFHPYNVGRLTIGLETIKPCTPLGIMKILEEMHEDVHGKNVVVIGASNIVGKPMASLLMQTGATVTLCHKFTRDISVHTKNADIVIIAAGVSNLLTGEMVCPGSVIIDVGINRTEDNNITGDVHFESTIKVAKAITPVPGGVGVMTVTMLLYNTLQIAKTQILLRNG